MKFNMNINEIIPHIHDSLSKPGAIGEYKETIDPGFLNGSIIDLETNDSRTPICFGYVTKSDLRIIYLKENTTEAWNNFRKTVQTRCESIPKPWLAYYSPFDQEALEQLLRTSCPFDGELMGTRMPKDRAAKILGFPGIYDPLEGRSIEVISNWNNYLENKDLKYLESIILHNRACLIKESFIGEQRGWWPVSDNYLPTEQVQHSDACINRLLKATQGKEIIEISYLDSKGIQSNRTIAPMSVGETYFNAFCYLANDKRTFKIDRITSIEETEE
jgi:hypothetical protein